MSRSHRKTPIRSILVCGISEKDDKARWHRRLRARDRRQLRALLRKTDCSPTGDTLDAFLPTHPREISNTILMRKEWRTYWLKTPDTDPERYRKWLAK